MSLVATGNNPSTHTNEPALDNVEFWPDIDPEEFRAAERLREDIPHARLLHALTAALADINRQLVEFMAAHMADGIQEHEAIPLQHWQRDTHYADLYRRAVYASAHADLLERYADYSATAAGDDRAQGKQDAADDYRRAARWAVSEIQGRTHATVELI